MKSIEIIGTDEIFRNNPEHPETNYKLRTYKWQVTRKSIETNLLTSQTIDLATNKVGTCTANKS